MTGSAVTPPNRPGWTVTRHGKALFVYTPAGEYAGAAGRIRTGSAAGRWWIHTAGGGDSPDTYPDRDAALAVIQAAWNRQEQGGSSR